MKLLSYHIENYGKIKNTDGQFDDKITCYCENNGFGKSTLASFIKAMFYGLAPYTASSKGFNDRQKYYPFDGRKFGGNVAFEYDGKTYRIERFFDKKSGKDDECKVYCNGAPFDGFGEEIGKMLFGLDEESFKKTIFITAEEIEVSSTHSINEKLNRTVEGVDENNDFEKAIERLEKAKKDLKAARGNNDKISGKQREIVELTAQIKNLQDMSKQLSVEYVEREQLFKEVKRLEQETKEATEHNLVLQKWENADSMARQKENKEQAIRVLKEKYSQGVPSKEEYLFLREQWENGNRLRGALQAIEFPLQKQNELEKLQLKFTNGIPMSALMEENQQKILHLTALETEKTRLENREDSEQEKLLVKKYSLGMPSEEGIQTNRSLAETYKKKDSELKERSAKLLQAATEKPSAKFNKEWYFLILSLALLCSGAGLWFVAKTVGIGLLIAGGIFLVVAGVLKAMNAAMPPTNEHFDLPSLQAEVKVLEEKLRSFMVPYGYYSEAGVLFDFAKMEEDLQSYKRWLAEKAERQKQYDTLLQTMQNIEKEISSFLQGYGEEGTDLQNAFNRLSSAISSYQALTADKEAAQAREKQLREELEITEKQMSPIFEKYGLSENVATMDGLNTLSSDIKAFSELQKEVDILEKDLAEYRAKNGLFNRPDEMEFDLDDLHNQLSKYRKALADCDKRIAETERFVEKLSDAENELTIAEEQLKEYKEKHALLTDTIKALKGAEQSLKDKYVAPIKTRFTKYAQSLERVFGEKIGMDQDFRVVFERGGEARSEKHLSAGERSLCALCLRLALIDNMYEKELPFIVMDDPFVHLDETHMERTKELLRELSQEKQIIYFCCHESRRV